MRSRPLEKRSHRGVCVACGAMIPSELMDENPNGLWCSENCRKKVLGAMNVPEGYDLKPVGNYNPSLALLVSHGDDRMLQRVVMVKI